LPILNMYKLFKSLFPKLYMITAIDIAIDIVLVLI
jgi:hypothetical protein